MQFLWHFLRRTASANLLSSQPSKQVEPEGSMAEQSSAGMKKTLGLTGVTINAMALIAPGAFLWITYQLQAANVDAASNPTTGDMWTGIVFALIIAFLIAFSFAELPRRYLDAGTGSSYYFAE